MTPELFSDAMNEIGAKYVEEALTYKRPAQRSFWSKLAKRAAMVALVALLALSQSRCAGRYDPLGGNVDGLAGLL
mgnify:CR=1 FL=1